MSKGNGKIFYTINNLGNTGVRSLTDSATGGNNPTRAVDAGNGFTMRQGYTLVDAGWEGDVLPGNFRLTVELPVATNAGATITAPILVEFHDRYTRDARIQANGGVSLPLSGSPDFASYESISTDQAVARAELGPARAGDDNDDARIDEIELTTRVSAALPGEAVTTPAFTYGRRA